MNDETTTIATETTKPYAEKAAHMTERLENLYKLYKAEADKLEADKGLLSSISESIQNALFDANSDAADLDALSLQLAKLESKYKLVESRCKPGNAIVKLVLGITEVEGVINGYSYQLARTALDSEKVKLISTYQVTNASFLPDGTTKMLEGMPSVQAARALNIAVPLSSVSSDDENPSSLLVMSHYRSCLDRLSKLAAITE
jgi:hypothetical protein